MWTSLTGKKFQWSNQPDGPMFFYHTLFEQSLLRFPHIHTVKYMNERWAVGDLKKKSKTKLSRWVRKLSVTVCVCEVLMGHNDSSPWKYHLFHQSKLICFK